MRDSGGMLDMWCIYDHPKDFPDHFIARRWVVSEQGAVATQDVRFGATLRDVRKALPLGLHRIERSIHDDPAVLETWL